MTRVLGYKITVLALIVLSVLATVSCGSDATGKDDVPRPTSATAERQRDADGAALLRSTIRITFPGEVALSGDAGDLLDHVRVQTPGGTQGLPAEELPIRSLRIDRQDPSVLVVETDGLVPGDSEVRIRREVLARGAEGSVATRVASDLTGLEVLLASYAMTPANAELYGQPVVAPVTAQDGDAAGMREALEEHLRQRGSNEETTARAVGAFDSVPTDIVPSPKLRAALASLTGTFAEPAIDHLLTGENCTGQPSERIAFQEPPEFPGILARVTYSEAGARIVSVNPDLEGELLQLLAPILLHEAIHCDREGAADEEVAATAFDTYYYLLVVASEPWVAREGTLLTRNYNVDALAMINSGRMVPESVGVLPSPGVSEVFPGLELEHGSFAEYIAAAYGQLAPVVSPDEALAQRYVANLAATLDLPVRSAYNLEYLDGLLGWTMDTAAFLAAIAALELEVVR